MSPHARTYDVHGVGIHVHDSGADVAGEPVFLLHGNPDSLGMWDGVVEALSDGPHGALRLIRPDMPGFGKSPEPPLSFDYRAAATTALWDGLFDQLGLTEPITMVLHDFGGPWALPWVARNPDRVRGLVICDSPYHPSFQWHFWARIWQTPLLGELAAKLSTRALVRHEMRRGSKGLSLAYCDQVFADMHPAMQRSVLRTYRSFADVHAAFAEEAPRLRDALQHIPTRIVWGGRDPYLPIDQAHTFGAEVDVVADAGHWTPVEAPEVVAAAVRAVRAASDRP